jgi:hypothetical protein
MQAWCLWAGDGTQQVRETERERGMRNESKIWHERNGFEVTGMGLRKTSFDEGRVELKKLRLMNSKKDMLKE